MNAHTANLQTADLLRQSEERYRALIEASTQAVWLWDASGTQTNFAGSQKWWEDITGQSIEEQTQNDAKWLEVVHPDDREVAKDLWDKATATGKSYDSTYRVRYKAGGWRHVRARGVPVRNSNGTVREWVGTLDDVTDQKEAGAIRERLLAEAEFQRKKLEDVFRHAPSFTAVLRGPNHIFERVNDRYVELIGGRDVVGLPVRNALPEVEGQGYFELLDQVYQTGKPISIIDATVTLRNPEGSTERALHFVYQPIIETDGRTSGVIVQGIDLTERKLAEERFQRLTEESESQRRMYETALSYTADFVYLFDLNGRFIYVNKSLLDLWGKDLSQAVGRNFHELDYPTELASKLQQQIQDVVATGKTKRDETTYTAANETRIYEYIFVPVLNENGKIEAVAGSTRDITDRKKTEEALRRSDQRHRALLSASSDVIYGMNANWTTMYPVDGRDFIPSSDAPCTNWLEQNVPIFEQARVKAAVNQAISNKSKFELEHQVSRLDGSLGWTFSRAIPILDDKGEIQEWFGIASDITRRKHAEAELQDIRSRMEAALSAGAIGTWSWDVIGDRFFGDVSFARIFSVEQSKVNGGNLAPILEAIHPDDQERVIGKINVALDKDDRYEADYHIAQPDGSWRWVMARGLVERDEAGRAIQMPGVVIDVTDWKRAEEKLSVITVESEQRRRLYETILSSTPDFVYVFSLDHRVLYANQALLTMWGKKWSEAAGKTFLELGYEDWHAERHCREIETVRSTREPIRGEVPFNGTHGRRIYDYIFIPVMNADCEVEAVAGTTRDVTQRRQLEDALRETDRRKDEFLAMLAHELRNPLVPIRSGLDILSMKSNADQETIDLMKDQTAHIIRLVDDLLDVSRIMQGKVELRLEQVNVADIVKRSIDSMKSLIEGNNQHLLVSLPPTAIWMNVDPVRIIQVLGNLLNNASKYTPAGGKIELEVKAEGDHALISVRDSGMGIESELLPRVFDLFTQSSRSLDRSQGGLGIGLTLVERLIHLHEGTVTASSEGPGLGSVFTIRLPQLEKATLPNKALPANSVILNGDHKHRIVVVDDNRSATWLISKLLSLLGNHEVYVAHDGESALDTIQEHLPEIVFLDIGLPGIDGYEVCKLIRKTEGLQDLLVIALSGYGQEQDRKKSKEAGFDEHLVKPPSVDQINEVLRHPKLRLKVKS